MDNFIKVAFFDLGDTLVGSQRNWLTGAEDTLAKLHEKNVRLGIISNTAELSRPEILELLPENFGDIPFEKKLVIFSSEVHVAKPDRKIFRLAVKRSLAPAGKCLFCTEEAAHTVNARLEGMKTITVRQDGVDIGNLVDKLTAMGLLPA